MISREGCRSGAKRVIPPGLRAFREVLMRNRYNIDGVTCNVYRAKNESEHFHQEIELLFVVDGYIRVFVEDNEYVVMSEQILLINSNKIHYMYVESNALVCKILISYELLAEMLGEDYVAFWCNYLTSKDSGYEDLQSVIKEIIFITINGDKRDAASLMERYGRLLNCLIRNFKIDRSVPNDGSLDSEEGKIREILGYINNNYNEPISLAELAGKMFVSVSTISRMFKKATGEKFPDYVNRIRLRYATADLMNTNKSITDVAIDNGFASPSTFNRVFRETYGTCPSQYKKSTRSALKSKESLTSDEKNQVMQHLDEKDIAQDTVKEVPTVDLILNTGKQVEDIFNKTITVGAVYRLVNSSIQKHVENMVSWLNFRYIRMWNLFAPSCMIATSADDRNLSFETIDTVLDFLVELKVHPFFDMTPHPECIVKNASERLYQEDDSMYFENIGQWKYFLNKFMDHAMFRYGEKEVSEWIFEFGDIGLEYYTNSEYIDVFDESYKIIKDHCPKTAVGGPDWMLDGREIKVVNYIEKWQKIGRYPDFYSVIIFPYTPDKGIGNENPYKGEKRRNMNPEFPKNQISSIRSRLKSAGAYERPIYITETTPIMSNRNAMNDHCTRASGVLREVGIFLDYVDMICFWVATDRLSMQFAPAGILHGGSGIVSKDGIRKPAYHALYFASKINGNLLSKGDGYIAVQSVQDNIYILCYNHKNLTYSYKDEEDKEVNRYNVDLLFEDKDSKIMKFMIHGLDEGEYVVKRQIVNQDYGSVMDEWRKLGFETEMRYSEIEYLRSICVPRIQMVRKVAEEGQMYLEAELKAHEIQMIHVYKR